MYNYSSSSNSRIIKDNSDIFDQIKQKAENLSTLDASTHLPNLSNPTNLTNPQIIGSKHEIYVHPKIIPKKIIHKSINSSKFSNSISESELHDRFLLKDRLKYLNEDNNNNIYNFQIENIKKINKRPFNKIKKLTKSSSCNLFEIKNNNDIWTQLKNTNFKTKDEKQIRINVRKYIPSRDYLNKAKKIQLLRFINKNKIDTFQNLKALHNESSNLLDLNYKSLENAYETLNDNYINKFIFNNKKIVSQKELEQIKNFELLKQKEKLKQEIIKLKQIYSKTKKEQKLLINVFIYQIQVKEKIPTISNNLNLCLENFSDKKFLDQIDNEIYNIIIPYKNKIIYNDITDYLEDKEMLEQKALDGFNKKERLALEIEQLKKQLNELFSYNDTTYENAEINEVLLKLNKLKEQNKFLSIKLKKLSLFKMPQIQKQGVKYFSSYSNKIKFYINKYANKNKLFHCLIKLYNTVEQCQFDNEFFEVEEEILLDENLLTLKIIKYVDDKITMLYEERRKYLNDDTSKIIYEKIENKFDKEKMKQNMIKILFKKEQRKIELEQKMKNKNNKYVYIPNKKIDYDHYIKAKKEYEETKKLLKEQKKPPIFEDFLYDVID